MDIPSLLSSLSSAINLGGMLVNERDRHKAATIQVDLTDKLIQAQVQVSQVLAAIIEKDRLIQVLSERVRELEAKQAEEARYQLAKLGAAGDFFAYRLRPAAELVERQDEPAHFLCQPCFDAGKKVVLQIDSFDAFCPACQASFPVGAHRSHPRGATGIYT